MLTPQPIGSSSAPAALEIVCAAFAPLPAVYQDHAAIPANKPLERFEQALGRASTDGYLLLFSDTPVGYVRVDAYRRTSVRSRICASCPHGRIAALRSRPCVSSRLTIRTRAHGVWSR